MDGYKKHVRLRAFTLHQIITQTSSTEEEFGFLKPAKGLAIMNPFLILQFESYQTAVASCHSRNAGLHKHSC